mmetsp:Transcript_10039/g.19288  ORF Transcript_10039/g.19288 Transcript_10039/m.19288 type:complete len:166 (-) Transcript_10039:297-794(-)
MGLAHMHTLSPSSLSLTLLPLLFVLSSLSLFSPSPFPFVSHGLTTQVPAAKVKRFACPHCKKRFMQKSNMIAHTRIHTGERPFKCTVCPRAFAQKSNLKRHIQIHSRKRKERSEAKAKMGHHDDTSRLHTTTHTHTTTTPPKPDTGEIDAQTTIRPFKKALVSSH